MAKFRKKAKTDSEIPTASMADIAFLLLVFFMVSTVLKLEEGLPISLPKAEAAQDIPRENVIHVWVDRVGKISINDMIVSVGSVEGIVAQRIRQNPGKNPHCRGIQKQNKGIPQLPQPQRRTHQGIWFRQFPGRKTNTSRFKEVFHKTVFE